MVRSEIEAYRDTVAPGDLRQVHSTAHEEHLGASMTSRFVEVPAAVIRERLTAAGFQLLPATSGEEVYGRAHDKDPRYMVKVYSSILRGAAEARGCGADAIRVVALFTPRDKTYPIFKSARVYRTGTVEAVLGRMIERAREAYVRCNEHRRERNAPMVK